MKVTEAVFQRMDARIATELAGAYDGCTANLILANAEKTPWVVVVFLFGSELQRKKEENNEEIEGLYGL